MSEYNEQQYLEHKMREFIEKCKPAVRALGYDGASAELSGHSREGSGSTPPFTWVVGYGKHKSWRGHVIFEAFAYFPTVTKRGTPETFVLEDEGRSVQIRYPYEAIPIDETIRDKVTVKEEQKDTYETHAELSVTTSISAEAKAGIEGVGEASVSTEVSTEASTGFGQASEETTATESEKEFEVHVSVDKGEAVEVTIELLKTRQVTEVIESGYLDFSGYIDFGSEYHGPAGRRLNFANRQYFVDLLDGKLRLDFPSITKPVYNGDDRVKHFRDWLANKDNFRVDLKRQEVKVFESVGNVSSEVINGE